MAENQSMTTAEVVAKTLIDEHADFLREAVVIVARELMEAEISARTGAGHGERSPERITNRNGYRERRWDTRAGSIELAIPRIRQGSYFPSFLEPGTRAEQALVAVIVEAYVNGVSTRKVDRLVEQMGVAGRGTGHTPSLPPEADGAAGETIPRPVRRSPALAVVAGGR